MHARARVRVCVCVCVCYVTSVRSNSLWSCVARQAPLSLGFSRQEHWSGLPCCSAACAPLSTWLISVALRPKTHFGRGRSLHWFSMASGVRDLGTWTLEMPLKLCGSEYHPCFSNGGKQCSPPLWGCIRSQRARAYGAPRAGAGR